jgi:hypothetical protein
MVLAAAMANVRGNLAEWPKINHENSRPDKGVVAPTGPEFLFSLYAVKGYDAHMALARILVDG